MKKILKYGIILTFVLSFFYIASGITINVSPDVSGDTIIRVFEKSQADILEANINTSLEVPNTLWGEEEIDRIKEDIKERLGLNEKKEVLVAEDFLYMNEEIENNDKNILYIHEFADNSSRQIIATNTNDNGDILTFKIHSAQVEDEKTSYIIIDIIQNKRYKGIVEKSKKNQEILKRYGNNIEVTMNLVGTYDKELSQVEGREKIQEILREIKGKKVEEVVEDTYISTTAYTPLIPQTIQYGNNKVNLQLAMRYNNYEDRTYLYIANPLITLTY